MAAFFTINGSLELAVGTGPIGSTLVEYGPKRDQVEVGSGGVELGRDLSD